MNDIVKTFLSLSLSGSIIAIILFAVKPFLKDKISKTWQYYIWLVVILRLLIPFTSEINILNGLFDLTEINVIISTDNASPNYHISNEKPLNEIANDNLLKEIEISQDVIENDIVTDNTNSTKILDSYLSDIQKNGWLVWLIISSILLLKKIISYHVYFCYIKSNRNLITDESIIATYDEVCDKAGIKRKIGLYSYKKINSPMLIGFLKPYILLPEAILKTTDGLQYILLHELTHYRRLDFLYKWFVQIAVCVHFFNPVVYFVRKSINKACEFSCDEMVVKKLDEPSKKAYGTTLINTLEVSAGYNQHAISFMLCEDVKIIKERLGAIMTYKKGNKFVLVITIFLTATISFGAIFTGAYAATNVNTLAPTLNRQNNVNSKEQEISKKEDEIKQEQPKIESDTNLSKDEAKHNQDSHNILIQYTIVQVNPNMTQYSSYIEYALTNNSNDTIKSLDLSLLAYDENGHPVRIRSFFDGLNNRLGEFELLINNNDINLKSQQILGLDTVWSLDDGHGIKYVIACVKQAEFEQQGNWENPYYKYWLEYYKEKNVSIELLQNYYGEVDLIENAFDIDNITQNTTNNNSFENLDFTTDILPINRDELHYEAMVLNKNPDDFTDELQYQATITEETIGDYKLKVSNFTNDITTVNASVFIDDELISNQLYMNELAEVHFDINRNFIGKTLKVLTSTSSLETGKADITVRRR